MYVLILLKKRKKKSIFNRIMRNTSEIYTKISKNVLFREKKDCNSERMENSNLF